MISLSGRFVKSGVKIDLLEITDSISRTKTLRCFSILHHLHGKVDDCPPPTTSVVAELCIFLI